MGHDFSWLKRAVIRMGAQAVDGVEQAIEALLNNDTAAAAAARETEKKVDAMYHAINEYCLEALSQTQYPRGEINFLVNSLKIAMELERICDYANQTAKLVQNKFSQQEMDSFRRLKPTVSEMKDQSLTMLKSALKSYESQNPDAAEAIKDQDAFVDKRNKDLYRNMICIGSVKPWVQEAIMDYHTAIRYLERVADRATNIAELVYYIVRGEAMKKISIREDIWDD